MTWYQQPIAPFDQAAADAALIRTNQLTKPPGSLGQLEAIVVQLAGLQSTAIPSVEKKHISIFAADHGVVSEGVSAFPQQVTKLMIDNFARGGAAINVLAKHNSCSFEVINLGLASSTPFDSIKGVRHELVANGTHNICEQAAMSEAQLVQALNIGRSAVQRHFPEMDLFIGGEMGIGNTTSAAALSCALLNHKAADIVGYGTGIDESAKKIKVKVVEKALALHEAHLSEPLSVLRHLGGFEIAALVGAYIASAQAKVPVVVDGFICTTAALLAARINSGVRPWFIFSHQSAEQGHAYLLQALNAKPILALDMRLGEGSGAAMVLPIIDLACKLHQEMASFEEAGIASDTAD